MLLINFAAYLMTLNKLLKLRMPHNPEDQEVLAKDDLRLIVIFLIPNNVWQQQEFQRKNDKNKKQIIRLVLTYFKNQQSFKDNLKHILKYEFYYNPTLSFASLKAIVLCPENTCAWCQFSNTKSFINC